MKNFYWEKKTIRNYLLTGAGLGILYAFAEYIARLGTDYPQELVPLLIRAPISGMLLMISVAAFESLLKDSFKQRRFLYLVIARSLVYTLIITFWLAVTQSIWYAVDDISPYKSQLIDYFTGQSYLINLATLLSITILVVGFDQINNLHTKGELLNFILGRYHAPKEVDRIFCFVDLKRSTTIAEKLGHYKYAMFLRDFFSDITEALQNTDAQIYQYVGDEIVLCWPFKKGLEDNNIINCFFFMQEAIEEEKEKYMDRYGVYPQFKAGLHGGNVIITWIGEIKKEIVYVGDVVNTTARIQEDCKRLSKDFLISGELLEEIGDIDHVRASFVEETVPRGKAKRVKLYSLEKTA